MPGVSKTAAGLAGGAPRLGYALGVTLRYRYLDTLTIGFIVVLVVSNLVGPKICQIGPLLVSGAQLLFPVTYICGDVFTEVYGYAASRRAIWLGFLANALLAIMGLITVWLPPAPGWAHQDAFATVFYQIPRLIVASLIAFWCGEFANSYTMARMKLPISSCIVTPTADASICVTGCPVSDVPRSR